MAKTTFAAISLIIAGLLTIGIAGLAPIFTGENHPSKNSAQSGGMEKIKIFSAGTGENGPKELEEKVAEWLKENAGVCRVVARTQSGDRFVIVITIWYRVAEDQ